VTNAAGDPTLTQRTWVLPSEAPDGGWGDSAAAGVALMARCDRRRLPEYAKNLLPPSVVSRPLEGEAPTIDIAVGYSKSNTSPILELFVSRLDELLRLKQRH
jgi:LysR family hca operon transcriptional activator